MKKKWMVIVAIGMLLLGVTGCNSKAEAEKDLEETIDKYGTVEKETVDILVSKFNTEVMNHSNGKMNPAMDEYLTIEKDQYWYGLLEGIYLVVVPMEFSNDKTKDIVDHMILYVENDMKYETDGTTYIKYLIKANNNALTTEDVNTLLEEAKEKAPQNENANNGKGISVGYSTNTDNNQYIVKRLYR